jgi:hypothetical protein
MRNYINLNQRRRKGPEVPSDANQQQAAMKHSRVSLEVFGKLWAPRGWVHLVDSTWHVTQPLLKPPQASDTWFWRHHAVTPICHADVDSVLWLVTWPEHRCQTYACSTAVLFRWNTAIHLHRYKNLQTIIQFVPQVCKHRFPILGSSNNIHKMTHNRNFVPLRPFPYLSSGVTETLSFKFNTHRTIPRQFDFVFRQFTIS